MDSEDRRRCPWAAGLWGRLAVLLVLGTISGAARAQAADTTPWAPGIRRVEEALARREFSAALRAANEAHEAAIRATNWERLVEVAGAYRHIGEVTGLRQSFDTKAREVYGRALFRARQQGSVEGVLGVAEGYLTLGDINTATQCVRVAERLAGRDPEARADVRAFAARLAEAGGNATAARP